MTIDEAIALGQTWAKRGVPAGPVGLSWDAAANKVHKRPLTGGGGGQGGFKRFSTDPERVRRMFNGATLKPGEEYGVGLWPGPAGLLVLDPDIDPHTGERIGIDTLADLEAEHGALPPHPIVVTVSGGEHHVLPKRPGTHVGNSDFADHIEVRSDAGYVIAPGTFCTWGEWKESPASGPLPTHDQVPDWVYGRLNGSSTGSHHGDGATGHWGRLDPERLHPADRAALEALLRLGGHDPYTANRGDQQYVMIPRPGRHAAGCSVGFIGPGVAHIFHREWWPLRQGVSYDADRLEEIADAVEAGDRQQAERLADPNYDTDQLAGQSENGSDEDEPEPPDLTVVPISEFAAVEEPGAEALLGDGDDALIPANGDVMVYGDGGAGKTTLCVDLACHAGAGIPWLGVPVPRPLNVLIVENEGPRPLFRAKLRRKLAGWPEDHPTGGRVRIIEKPWANLSFANALHREALARSIAEHETDVLIIGPLACSGMEEAGTLADVRYFLALVADMRQRADRAVTVILVHHENKGGQVSGAWEGSGDTLLHVQGRGHGRTAVYVQKARWSTSHHATTMELRWTEGEGFEIEENPESTDDDIADAIVDVVSCNPGTGWTKVREKVTGVREKRRTTIRDRLLKTGTLVNVVKVDGVETVLDHCPERRPARLYLADDPAIAHLVPGPEPDGNQTGSPRGRAETPSGSLVPSYRGNQDGNQTSGASPHPDLEDSETVEAFNRLDGHPFAELLSKHPDARTVCMECGEDYPLVDFPEHEQRHVIQEAFPGATLIDPKEPT